MDLYFSQFLLRADGCHPKGSFKRLLLKIMSVICVFPLTDIVWLDYVMSGIYNLQLQILLLPAKNKM